MATRFLLLALQMGRTKGVLDDDGVASWTAEPRALPARQSFDRRAGLFGAEQEVLHVGGDMLDRPAHGDALAPARRDGLGDGPVIDL